MARRWRCVKRIQDNWDNFIVGKVYEVNVNGHLVTENGVELTTVGSEVDKSWLKSHYIFEEVKDMFTKADLQQFDVVRTSSGRYYMFLSGGPYADGTFVRVMSDECGFMRPNAYNDELTFHNPYFSIDEVLRPIFRSAAPLTKEILYNPVLYKQVFDRKAIPPAKELTVAEIEKLLGYSVKIVKEV